MSELVNNSIPAELDTTSKPKKVVNLKFLWISVSFTFLSCCFGSGLLAIPSIASMMGLIPFLIMNIFAASFSYFCFHQIIKAQYNNNCEEKTLTTLISKYYNKIWLVLMDLSIIFCLLPISYIAVSADYFRTFISTIFKVSSMNNNSWVIGMKFITCLCVMYPLTFIKTIKVLNYVASLSIVFVFVSVAFVLVEFGIWKSTGTLNGIDHPTPKFAWWPSSASQVPNVLTYICMFFSLYSMHASIVCIMYEYMKDFRPEDRDRFLSKEIRQFIQKAIYGITLPVAFVVYTGYGIIGLLMFDQTCSAGQAGCIQANSNVLLTFTNNVAAVIIELLFSIVVFVSFPCMLYPIRKSMIAFCKLELDTNKTKDYLIYNAIGLVITLVCLLIAVFLTQISQIQSFSANLLGIILYALSGVMLWYRAGPDVKDELVGLLKPEQGQKVEEVMWRTVVFWVATAILVGLNIAALGCQIYTWCV